jgi:hypothetical protein
MPENHPAFEAGDDIAGQGRKELFHGEVAGSICDVTAPTQIGRLTAAKQGKTSFHGAFADSAAAYYDVAMIKAIGMTTVLAGFLLWMADVSQADQVVMQNGDTFNGKVLSMTTNSLVFQNDNLGTVTLLRSKITGITFGTAVAAPLLKASPTNLIVIGQSATPEPETNSSSDLTEALRELRDQTNLVQQVQSQVLGSANPAAVNKFNQMIDDLSTGKMSMNDLRAQAQSAADQLRALGPGAGEEANSYLTILDNFLQETAPGNGSTNSTAP